MTDLDRTAQSLLDQVLADRSDRFKAKVLELVVRYRWDVNDPNFLILLATGQMEVLLEAFPEQYERMFAQSLVQVDQQKLALKGVIQASEFAHTQRMNDLAAQITKLEKMIPEQFHHVNQEVHQILEFAKNERQRMLADMEKQSNQLTLEVQQSIEKRAMQLIWQAGEATRDKHYYESWIGLSIGVLITISAGWVMGWFTRGLF